MGDRAAIDFIGLGAIKSGSTWMAKCLSQHPEIVFSGEKTVKEVHFFASDDNPILQGHFRSRYRRGMKWYLDQFPPARAGKPRGEFSNSYLPDSTACARIKQCFPKAKLLAILRNPPDMLYSLYWWFRGTILRDVPDTFEQFCRMARYRDLGLYHRHLTPYFTTFSPGAIKVFFLDDIAARPERVVEELYTFLDVDASFQPSVLHQRINPARAPRSNLLRRCARVLPVMLRKLGMTAAYYWLCENVRLWRLYRGINLGRYRYPEMKPEDRARLQDFFRDDVGLLEQLLGREVPDRWRFPHPPSEELA